MIGWILDKIFSLIPFLHDRNKAKSAAKVRLQHLRGQLILYALQGSLYSGKFDKELIEWANNAFSSSPDLSQHEEYGEVDKFLKIILKEPEKFEMAFKIIQTNQQRTTKFFPKLETPVIEEKYLTKDDIRLFSEFSSKITAINSMTDDIRNLHEKTFDNSLNEYQRNSVQESMSSTYNNLSNQSKIAVNKIRKMKLLRE